MEIRALKILLLISWMFHVEVTQVYAFESESFQLKNRFFVMDFGMVFAKPEFKKIDSVVIRNSKNSSEATPVIGSVNQAYPDTLAQTLHARFLLEESTHTTLDFQSFLPLNGFAQIDTGNTDLPEYVLYRVENQRPRVKIMGERNLSDSFRLGLGVDLGFGLTSEATISLQSGAGKYSTQRISARAKPRLIPLIQAEWNEFKFLIRGENKVDFSFDSSAGTSVFGGSAGFDISYDSQSSLFFDPWRFDLSRKIPLKSLGLETWTTEWGISYQLWSGYQPRTSLISNISGTFSNGQMPGFKARNLWVPRVSIEKQFNSQRWSLAYEFKDSIFTALPSGFGNFLDPPRHSVWLDSLFQLASGWEWGLGLQVTRLAAQSVLKSDSTEIGAPGYESSGWIYGGSLNLVIPISVAAKN